MPRTRSICAAALLAACSSKAVDTATDTTTTTGSSSAPDTTDTSAATTEGDDSTTTTTSTTSSSSAPTSTTAAPTTGTVTTTGDDTTTTTGTTTEAMPSGPNVDVSDPQLYEFSFKANEADPAAALALGNQLAELDTTAPLQGRLVVYLHGAGAPTTCGSQAHGVVLARMGFHVIHPCYVSDYGVGNCGDDIGGCRLEAFEGVDHHDFIDIPPPDSIETRVVKMLEHLQALHPGGDWQYFIEDGKPRWSEIVISGISHGASSSGVIGMNRAVERVVMLSGPLDSDQAWLKGDPLTPIDRFWGFTHTGDEQHPGHLQSFADMMLPGEPFVVDGAAPPYMDSHRLVTSAATGDGHGSTQAGGASPKDGDVYVFEPVWRAMYGAD
ncbi:BPSS1187 family protein [Nannocystis pusilla]|uniref:BPSS1187 family protein n=1 Tax=Nannocystis pusilla TaxID=889268 RepID=UPI003BF1663C